MKNVAIFKSRSRLRYEEVVAEFLQIRSAINSAEESLEMLNLSTIHSFYEDETLYMGQRGFVAMVAGIGQLESFQDHEWGLCALLEPLNITKWDRLARLAKKYVNGEVVTCTASDKSLQLAWYAWLNWYNQQIQDL